LSVSIGSVKSTSVIVNNQNVSYTLPTLQAAFIFDYFFFTNMAISLSIGGSFLIDVNTPLPTLEFSMGASYRM